MVKKKKAVAVQRAIDMPFGATSRKQQMIMDCKAQILIMGGGV